MRHWHGTIVAPPGKMAVLGYGVSCDARRGDVFYWDEAVFLDLARDVDPNVALTMLDAPAEVKEAA